MLSRGGKGLPTGPFKGRRCPSVLDRARISMFPVQALDRTRGHPKTGPLQGLDEQDLDRTRGYPSTSTGPGQDLTWTGPGQD